ncbi:hypothetical protein BC628DRAFT_1343492 [Trametes gibbosa]|nr:hypothetical protein BC628DRAFT_1343492 [Trametes gibbosa]
MFSLSGLCRRVVPNVSPQPLAARVPRCEGFQTVSIGLPVSSLVPPMSIISGFPGQRISLSPMRFVSTSTKSNLEADLPDLPDAPPYPCPFLTDEQIATYLTPLYARAWSVRGSNPHPRRPAPELVKQFCFTTQERLDAFRRDVDIVTQIEDHHPSKELNQSDTPSIVIRVHTHSGLRPARDADEPRRARIQPGITLRDIRFAYLVEQRFSASLHGLSSGRMCMTNPVDPSLQPRTASAVEKCRHMFT